MKRIYFLRITVELLDYHSTVISNLEKRFFETGKKEFSSFHFFLEKMIKKALMFLIESLKRLLKNERFFNRFAFYLAVFLIFWGLVHLLKKMVLNRIIEGE